MNTSVPKPKDLKAKPSKLYILMEIKREEPFTEQDAHQVVNELENQLVDADDGSNCLIIDDEEFSVTYKILNKEGQ